MGFAGCVAAFASGCSVYGPGLLDAPLSAGGADEAGGASGASGSSAGGVSDGGTLGQAGIANGGLGGTEAQGGTSAGGSSGAGAAGGSAGAPGGSGPALDLIDNLEDGDKQVTIINNPLRNGIWDTGNDASAGGKQTPTQGTFKPVELGADVPYPGDRYAAYTKGSGFLLYGAFMNVSMRVNPDPILSQYDASKFTGLSFWAKVGPTSTKAMRVRFISGDTDPRGSLCKDPNSKPTPPTTEYCFNHYYAALALATTWKQYQVPFSSFHQGSDGKAFDTINLKTMYALEFYFNVDETFEVWIDDLSFIK